MDPQWSATALYVARNRRRSRRLDTSAGRSVAGVCRRSAGQRYRGAGDHSDRKTYGPVLMISGQADQMSSPKLAEIAVRRAQQYNFAFPLEHLSYPDAGHMVANV